MAAKKRKRISAKMEVPSLSTLMKESDRGCVILTTSLLDYMLTKLHEAYIALHLAGTTYPNDIFHSLTATFGPLSTFSGKIKLAFAYGLISLNEFKVLESVRQLRNEAAHDATIFSFEDEGVKKLVTGLVEFDRNEINMFGYARKKFMEIPEHKRIFILVCYGLHLTLGDKVADNIEALIKKSDQLKKT